MLKNGQVLNSRYQIQSTLGEGGFGAVYKMWDDNLQDFSKDDFKFLPEVLDRAADAALEFVMKGLNAAMNKFNGGVEP